MAVVSRWRGLTLAAAALSMAGCAGLGEFADLPQPLRSEAKVRKSRCDAIERSLAPSYDRSGQIKVLNVSIGAREATMNAASARDQYLAALHDLLLACREWQSFQRTPEEFRAARLAFAKVYQGAVDQASVSTAMTSLAQTLAQAETERQDDRDAVQAELSRIAEWLEQPADLGPGMADLTAKLAALEGQVGELKALLTPPAGGQGDAPAAGGAWTLTFASGSESPDPQAAASLAETLRRLPLGGTAKVVVVGYADTNGSEAKNLGLSQRRAASVQRALQARGVPVAVAAAGGETRAFGEDAAANRIARVLVLNGAAAQ